MNARSELQFVPTGAKVTRINNGMDDPFAPPHALRYIPSPITQFTIWIEMWDEERGEVWEIEMEVSGEGEGEMRRRLATGAEAKRGKAIYRAHKRFVEEGKRR